MRRTADDLFDGDADRCRLRRRDLGRLGGECSRSADVSSHRCACGSGRSIPSPVLELQRAGPPSSGPPRSPGFGLWLGATVVGLLKPGPHLRSVAAVTWIALMLDATTGLYKMQSGTPFPNGLTLGSWDIPRIFFGREYVSTLLVKHVLTVAAF